MKQENPSRRAFLTNLSKLSLLSALPAPLMGARPSGDGRSPAQKPVLATGPYLQFLMPTEVTIMWITESPSFSFVEYGDGSFIYKKAYQAEDGLIQANNRVKRVTIRRLKPDTSYQYQIVTSEIVDFQPYEVKFRATSKSDVFHFRTPADREDSVSWVIMNDIHDHPESISQLLYQLGSKGNTREYDFVVFNGDTFSFLESEQQIIDHLLSPCEDVFAREVPFYLNRGNHETRGSFARELKDYFYYPENRYYYAFTRGPVQFLMLDTGEDKADDNWAYSGLTAFDPYREEEARWLATEIQKPAFREAPFRVVMMHIPPFYAGDWHGTEECKRLFTPLFKEGKIDLLICAHVHHYSVHDPHADNQPYPVIIGGGPTPGKRTLIKVQADRDRLSLSMLRDDGTEVGKYAIKSRK